MFNFTAWPEMLAWPYLMLQGWLPYRDIAIAHNPLLLLDLAIFFKIFGLGVMQLKVYTWILIGFNVYITYLVANKFWGKKAAVLASIVYSAFCIIYQGNGLWFDLALTPFALLLYLFAREKRYIWLGIIFALGFLTKQTFVYFLIPIAYYILRSPTFKKDILRFAVGLTSVVTIFAICMAILGILDDYYNWAIKFGIFYLPQAEGQVLLPNLKQLLFAFAPFVIFVFISEPLVLLFALVGLMGVYPRWELFHFQPALPFLAFTWASALITTKRKTGFKLLLITLGIFYIAYGLGREAGNETRFIESSVKNVATAIDEEDQDSSIYVINYWDNLYALSDTTPATRPLIPYIPWYLNYKDSKESILMDLKVNMPEVVVIGERDQVFPEVYNFVDKYYSCSIVEAKVELCERN